MFSVTHMEKTDQGYRLPEKIRRDSYANYLLEGEKRLPTYVVKCLFFGRRENISTIQFLEVKRIELVISI